MPIASRKLMFSALLTALVFAVLASAARAQAKQDPYFGTWVLNVARSRYDPGPPPKSSILKREPVPGTDIIKTTSDTVDAQGNKSHHEYSATYDGTDYPMKGAADFDMSASRRLDPYTFLFVRKKNGKVVQISRGVISKDGKTFTSAEVGIHANGQSFHNVTVSEKQ